MPPVLQQQYSPEFCRASERRNVQGMETYVKQNRAPTNADADEKTPPGYAAWLTVAEVAVLTECSRSSTQCLRLAKMGIPFRQNFAGRPLVERAAVLRHHERPERARDQPNWNAIGAA